uniref:Uncharacterized protein n=1 Tax=Romanomermis culicivorax TaxID=13658 RepID=A0A915HZA6_ROMCU
MKMILGSKISVDSSWKFDVAYVRKSHKSHFWLFKKNKAKREFDGLQTVYYERNNRAKIGREKSRVLVRDGRVKSDPEVGHNVQCASTDATTTETLRVKREII